MTDKEKARLLDMSTKTDLTRMSEKHLKGLSLSEEDYSIFQDSYLLKSFADHPLTSLQIKV
jgi:hypothetical protein